jgi:PAS domain S-box-containing protein
MFRTSVENIAIRLESESVVIAKGAKKPVAVAIWDSASGCRVSWPKSAGQQIIFPEIKNEKMYSGTYTLASKETKSYILAQIIDSQQQDNQKKAWGFVIATSYPERQWTIAEGRILIDLASDISKVISTEEELSGSNHAKGDRSCDLFIRTDISGVVESAIGDSDKLFGLDAPSLIGRRIADLVLAANKDDSNLIENIAFSNNNKFMTVVKTNIHDRDMLRRVLFRAEYDNKSKGCSIYLTDITGLEGLIDDTTIDLSLFMTEGLIIVDSNFNIIFVNEADRRNRGFSLEESKKQSIRDVLSSDDMEWILSSIDVKREALDTEVSITTRDHTSFPAAIRITPVFSEQGSLVKMACAYRNIEKEKVNEISLIEKEKLKTWNDSAMDGYIVMDTSCRPKYISASMTRLTGMGLNTLYDLLYKSPEEVFDSMKAEVFKEEVIRRVSGSELKPLRLIPVKRNEGAAKRIEAVISHISGSSHMEDVYMMQCRDATLELIEESLVLSVKEAFPIADETVDCTFRINNDGTIVEANRAAARVLGIKMSDVGSENLFNLVSGKQKGWLKEAMSIADGPILISEPRRYNFKQRTSSGDECALAFGKTPSGYSCAIRSLRWQDGSKIPEALVRATIERIGGFIFSTDINIKYTFISSQIENVTGWSPDDVRSLTADKIFTPDALSTMARAFREGVKMCRLAKTWSKKINITIIKKSGEQASAILDLSNVRDNQKAMSGFLGIVTMCVPAGCDPVS